MDLNRLRMAEDPACSWTKEDLSRIEYLAGGLSKEEVLATFYLTTTDVTPADMKVFDLAFAKGRAEAKSKAVNNLFTQMQSRDGVKGALAYLVRFGDDWPSIEEETSKSGERTFKVSFSK